MRVWIVRVLACVTRTVNGTGQRGLTGPSFVLPPNGADAAVGARRGAKRKPIGSEMRVFLRPPLSSMCNNLSEMFVCLCRISTCT